jgi:hypothetical protein
MEDIIIKVEDCDMNHVIEQDLGMRVYKEDQGIGAYEFWGSKGNHVDVVNILDCQNGNDFILEIEVDTDGEEMTNDWLKDEVSGVVNLNGNYAEPIGEYEEIDSDYALEFTDDPKLIRKKGSLELWHVPMKVTE